MASASSHAVEARYGRLMPTHRPTSHHDTGLVAIPVRAALANPASRPTLSATICRIFAALNWATCSGVISFLAGGAAPSCCCSTLHPLIVAQS
jgi:hypothetical protein